MAVTYAVIAGSERETRAALQQLVDVLGLEWATLPTPLPGQSKWLGRVTTPELDTARTLPAVASQPERTTRSPQPRRHPRRGRP